MDPKLKEVFETEYAKIPEFVQSFLEKNSLKDKLEKYFADQNKDVEYNSFTAYINVMLGDADGDDEYEATFPLKDLPLLRKWFEAYSKKYPEDVNKEYFTVCILMRDPNSLASFKGFNIFFKARLHEYNDKISSNSRYNAIFVTKFSFSNNCLLI